MEILNILLIFLAVAVIWTVIKIAFKITAKIFTCGFIAIAAIGIIILVLGNG